MPVPIYADPEDQAPMHRQVKNILNRDGAFMACLNRLAKEAKPTNEKIVVSATRFGTALILRAFRTKGVPAWKDLHESEIPDRKVFWFVLDESGEKVSSLNHPDLTGLVYGSAVQTCTVLDCIELIDIPVNTSAA